MGIKGSDERGPDVDVGVDEERERFRLMVAVVRRR